MAGARSYSSKSGRIVHTDGEGNVTGVSYRNPHSGRVTHYDADGNKTGVSYSSLRGTTVTHYDADGNRTGRTYVNSHGGMTHYDEAGNKTGNTFMNSHGGMAHSGPAFGSGSPDSSSPGCEPRSGQKTTVKAERSAVLGIVLLCVVWFLVLYMANGS